MKKCKICKKNHGGFNENIDQQINKMFQNFLIKSAKLIYKINTPARKEVMDNDVAFKSLLESRKFYLDFNDFNNGINDLINIIEDYNN